MALPGDRLHPGVQGSGFNNNYLTEICSGSDKDSYLRLTDLKACLEVSCRSPLGDALCSSLGFRICPIRFRAWGVHLFFSLLDYSHA